MKSVTDQYHGIIDPIAAQISYTPYKKGR